MEEHLSILLLKRGGINGLESLVRRYYPEGVRAVYMVVRDEAAAEDIVRSSFIHLLQTIRQ